MWIGWVQQLHKGTPIRSFFLIRSNTCVLTDPAQIEMRVIHFFRVSHNTAWLRHQFLWSAQEWPLTFQRSKIRIWLTFGLHSVRFYRHRVNEFAEFETKNHRQFCHCQILLYWQGDFAVAARTRSAAWHHIASSVLFKTRSVFCRHLHEVVVLRHWGQFQLSFWRPSWLCTHELPTAPTHDPKHRRKEHLF